MKIKTIICVSMASLLIACGPSAAEIEAEIKEKRALMDAEQEAAKKEVDHLELVLGNNGVVFFEKSKCKIQFPGLSYEGQLWYKEEKGKMTITYDTDDGRYILETILKTPKSDLLRYFNGALVAMDIEYDYTGNDSAIKDTLDGMYRVTYKTKGISGRKNHGSHRFFYNNGVVYGLYCINSGSHMNQPLVDSFFDSFEFIE